MNRKIVFLVFIISVSVFMHYFNQHAILKDARLTNELTETYKSQKDINLNLVTVNSKLGSRERIQKLAFENLGMFYPQDATSVHNIVMNNRDETFCLVDFIAPSAEALTK